MKMKKKTGITRPHPDGGVLNTLFYPMSQSDSWKDILMFSQGLKIPVVDPGR